MAENNAKNKFLEENTIKLMELMIENSNILTWNVFLPQFSKIGIFGVFRGCDVILMTSAKLSDIIDKIIMPNYSYNDILYTCQVLLT